MFEDKRSLAPVGGRDRRVVGDTVSHNRLCLKKREVLHLLVAERARLWAGARTQTIVPSLGAGENIIVDNCDTKYPSKHHMQNTCQI